MVSPANSHLSAPPSQTQYPVFVAYTHHFPVNPSPLGTPQPGIDVPIRLDQFPPSRMHSPCSNQRHESPTHRRLQVARDAIKNGAVWTARRSGKAGKTGFKKFVIQISIGSPLSILITAVAIAALVIFSPKIMAVFATPVAVSALIFSGKILIGGALCTGVVLGCHSLYNIITSHPSNEKAVHSDNKP